MPMTLEVNGASGRSSGLGDRALGLGTDAACSQLCELERHFALPNLFPGLENGVTSLAPPARIDEIIVLI